MFFLLFLPTVLANYSEMVRPNGPCYGEERDWNCVRSWDLETYEKLGETDRYGFNKDEDHGSRSQTDLFDRSYNLSDTIPQFASNYLVLDFPEELRTVIEWYKNNKQNSVNEIIPGHYSNDKETDALSVLSLDKNKSMHQMIQKIMKPILAWWSGESEDDLEFQSLYGVREYHRDSMMLFHLDRHNSHHISAVVHLNQEGLEEGWPFSINIGDKVSEIFCTKPCLVLYESAKRFHGRVRRLQGDSYASCFIHYRFKEHLLQQYKEQMKKDEL